MSTKNTLIPYPAPAHKDATIIGQHWRITVLSPRLVRVEWNEHDDFVDGRTQLIENRLFDKPAYTVAHYGSGVHVSTDILDVFYDGHEFSAQGLHIKVRVRAGVPYGSDWHYGQTIRVNSRFENLGGTARTLDGIDGAAELEPGILARNGYAVIDDSDSLLRTEDGWIVPRQSPGKDLYFFGYGSDYRSALTDYFSLTGASPLIPRYALGNWWSRYWPYSDQEYRSLLEVFSEHRVPFSVAVLDMDWHITDVDPAIGSGWTGYTWNRDLFPDPDSFLEELHKRGMHVSLNVHPAAGIRRHEEAYSRVAHALGMDSESGAPVDFDVTSQDFMRAYFDLVHHPLEDQGVDVWWIDWQQGTQTSIPGLDPLWMLNYLHYEDACKQLEVKKNKLDTSATSPNASIILSRYAGLGSHRYPIGFSGDTITTWESLDFQPYFTATAANVGYNWWSHDIGGHMMGVRNVELATRWLQFGVFSPINRLHSSMSAFASKEPWNFPQPAQQIQERFLRFRHQLVPYLYTSMCRSHREAVAPIRPIYHDFPEENQAYVHRNEYFFGSLIAVPITSPESSATHLARSDAWLPPGEWTDIFTGQQYSGGTNVAFYRPLDSFPVLAPSGGIITLASDALEPLDHAPWALTCMVFLNAEGTAHGVLIEDGGDGLGSESRYDISVWSEKNGSIGCEIRGSGNSRDRLCELSIMVVGYENLDTVAGRVAYCDSLDMLAPGALQTFGEVNLAHFRGTIDGVHVRDDSRDRRIYEILDRSEIQLLVKEQAWDIVRAHSQRGWLSSSASCINELLVAGVENDLLGAISEVLR
ncbi:MAG: alpha-xylosidase [Arcanobacterium sp.]|nr:alpha-xylosidase [Arcanobacterium sp.]